MPEQEIDFGFLFSQVSHFYSMSFQSVMAMPIKAFWLMSGNIRRLMAERDLRELSVAVAAESGEMLREYQEKLILEMGVIVKTPIGVDIERDEKGFAELKAMAELM